MKAKRIFCLFMTAAMLVFGMPGMAEQTGSEEEALLTQQTEAEAIPEAPTAAPTVKVTEAPTAAPTVYVTEAPTAAPTVYVTEAPTAAPTAYVTEAPTAAPTVYVTEAPTTAPTAEVTEAPTAAPTTEVTEMPAENLPAENTQAPAEVPGPQITEMPAENTEAEDEPDQEENPQTDAEEVPEEDTASGGETQENPPAETPEDEPAQDNAPVEEPVEDETHSPSEENSPEAPETEESADGEDETEEIPFTPGYIRVGKNTGLYQRLNDLHASMRTASEAILYAVSLEETASGTQRLEAALNLEGKESRAYLALHDAVFLSEKETLHLIAHPEKDSLGVGVNGQYPIPLTQVEDIREEKEADGAENAEEEPQAEETAELFEADITPSPAPDAPEVTDAPAVTADHPDPTVQGKTAIPYSLVNYEGQSLYKTKTAETRTLTGYSEDNLPASSHDGTDHSDTVYRIDVQNASNISLHFSTQTSMVSGYDVLVVYHADGSYAAGYTGRDAAGKVITVKGYACFVRYLHGSEEDGRGFAVDALQGYTQTVITAVTNHADGNITVKWERPFSSLSYQVQRAEVNPQTGAVGTYATLASGVSADLYRDGTAVPGILYAYRVRAYTTLGSKNYYAKFASCRMLSLRAPVISRGEAGESGDGPAISMAWNATPGADRYEVYRSDAKAGPYAAVGSTELLTFTDTDCARKTYYYKIKPYGTVNGTEYPGYSGSPVAIGYAGIPDISNIFSLSTTSVKIAWNEIAGADGYIVYRSTSGKDSGYSRIGSVTGDASYRDTAASGGTVNYYKVRSYRRIDGQNVFSDYSDAVGIYPLDMPGGLKVSKQTSVSASVQWNAVAGATAYEVFSGNQAGSVSSLGIFTETSMTVDGINEMDEAVYVRVKAIRDDGELVSKSYSAAAQTVMNPVVYRALLIGNWDYQVASKLSGPINDVHAMQTIMRQFSATGYTVSAAINATTAQMKSRMMITFRNADCNDVNLLFYSGHGSAAGSLCGVDALVFDTGAEYNTMSPYALRSCLDQFQGKKIVIIDACYSGKVIGKTARGVRASSADFTSHFLSAFAQKARSSQDLASGGYYVLTACSGSQLSWEMPVNDTYYGIFTRALTYGCGWDVYSGARLAKKNADQDTNGQIDLTELYQYTVRRIQVLLKGSPEDQSVQIYPSGSRQVVFGE